MSKLGGYLRLMRPANCLMMGIAVIVGASLASPRSLNIYWRNLIYGFTTGFTLTAASMTINDYHDREIDAVNEPSRPIPSGLIGLEEAIGFAFILTTIGFAVAYLTNIFCVIVAIIAWIVFLIYTVVGKRSGLPGNLLVSTCVSIPFVYGSLALVNAVEPKVLIFASMAFLSNTGREITKGIVDIEGDEMGNVKTVAVRYGTRNAAFAAATFYLAAVLLSPVPWLLKLVSLWFIPFVAVTDLGLLASSFALLKDTSRENARNVKNMILLWFAIGLFAFIIGTIT